jgi:hypothetical protein
MPHLVISCSNTKRQELLAGNYDSPYAAAFKFQAAAHHIGHSIPVPNSSYFKKFNYNRVTLHACTVTIQHTANEG